jgi:type III pantothenate kinase
VWLEYSRLIFCDIGNTSYDFFDENEKRKILVCEFDPSSEKREVFYICVNSEVSQQLDSLQNWIDLESYVDRNRYYETMGIDRIVGCEALQNGVIIDAGTAITVDIVRDGEFKGGYILPGLYNSQKCYKEVSSKLDYSYNFEIDLDKIPRNSQDAITYGQLGLLYRDVMSYHLPLYLTGGDAQKLKPLFKYALLDEELLFKGMKNIMKKANLC